MHAMGIRRSVQGYGTAVGAFVLAGVFAVAGPVRADIYAYTDDTGTHYSNVPADDRYALYLKEERPPEFRGPPRGDWRTRASQYSELIERTAKETAISPSLLKAVIAVESSFEAAAVSPKGAQGLMQLHPRTARRYGVENAFDPEQNVRGGARYLADLVQRYGTLELALAAYNAGEGAVERFGRRIPPFRETRAYVPAVLKVYWSLEHIGRPGRT